MARSDLALRRRLLRDPRGPVGVDLARRGIRVTNSAKVYAPVRFGRLRASITATDPLPVPRGLRIRIGSNVVYALAVHEGSGSRFAPPSWRVAHSRGRGVPARRFLVNALPAGRG